MMTAAPEPQLDAIPSPDGRDAASSCGQRRRDEGHLMKLEQLEAFLAVVEHGSTLGAARALDRRRGTVRRQLAELEESVGVELLVRTARGSILTRQGEEFAGRASGLLADARGLRDFARTGDGLRRLRLGVPPGTPPQGYVVLTRMLQSILPGIRVSYRTCGRSEAFADPNIDMFAQFSDHLPPGPHRTFVSLRFPIRILASPSYLEERGRPATAEDLAGHDLLAWTGYRPERSDLWPRLDGTTFALRPCVMSDDTHVLRAMANAGLGLALVADAVQMVGKNVGEVLEPVLDDLVGERGRMRILLPERSARSAEVRAVVRMVREIGLPEADWPEM